MLCAALLIVPRIAHAQACPTTTGVALLASVGRVERPRPLEADGLGFGLRLEWSPTPNLFTRGAYHRADMNGQNFHTAAVGSALRLGGPGRPCVTLDVLLSSGGSQNPGDYYRNVTLPIGIVFAYPLHWGGIVLVPSAGTRALFSATDARLLSFDVRRQAWGYGAVAAVRLQAKRIVTELTVQATRLTSSIGPQPLGRFRADLSLGFRL